MVTDFVQAGSAVEKVLTATATGLGKVAGAAVVGGGQSALIGGAELAASNAIGRAFGEKPVLGTAVLKAVAEDGALGTVLGQGSASGLHHRAPDHPGDVHHRDRLEPVYHCDQPAHRPARQTLAIAVSRGGGPAVGFGDPQAGSHRVGEELLCRILRDIEVRHEPDIQVTGSGNVDGTVVHRGRAGR